MTASRAGLSYCAGQARRYDRDRYLCALFAPAGRREALFALLAFNAEVARIREAVSEPMLGLVRLQWWRDAIGGIYAGAPPRHAVVEALSLAVERHGLGRGEFDRLIDAREFDLGDEPPADMGALVDYAEATSSTLARLALAVLGADGGAAREAARHVGIGWALTGLLRAAPFHARARRCYLPADRTSAAAVDALFKLKPSPELAVPVAEVATAARGHLAQARALRPRLGRNALPALLPATLADAYLERLRRAAYNPFDDRIEASPLSLQLRLTVAAALGRY